jgi:hypothetical protein
MTSATSSALFLTDTSTCSPSAALVLDGLFLLSDVRTDFHRLQKRVDRKDEWKPECPPLCPIRDLGLYMRPTPSGVLHHRRDICAWQM